MKPQAGLARRRHPRIDIDGGHGAQDLTDGHYVRIRDVSVGGLQTETPRETVPGAMHTFRVVFGMGDPAWYGDCDALSCGAWRTARFSCWLESCSRPCHGGGNRSIDRRSNNDYPK